MKWKEWLYFCPEAERVHAAGSLLSHMNYLCHRTKMMARRRQAVVEHTQFRNFTVLLQTHQKQRVSKKALHARCAILDGLDTGVKSAGAPKVYAQV
jgi:hypothetical protein